MKGSEQLALIDRLRAQPSESEWLEFKRSRCEPQLLGEYLSALANSACLANQPRGYLVLGIDDTAHEVAGTDFDPRAAKGKGNQDLLLWLAAGLEPNPGFEVRVVEHPDGRVVLFEVGPAKDQPVSFYGTAYVRVGTSKTELRNHPEKARALWTRGSDWSAELCEGATLDDLDPEAVARAREVFAVKHPRQADEASEWDDRTLLNKARVLKQGALTNAAILLLGRGESATLLSPAVARLTPEQKLRRIHNLLQELRRAGRIVNRGSRAHPQWVVPDAASGQGRR
ncbi:MAG: putative DNA binding domain-containing protein [Planctomycetes bacterium]|nr:putative DNA binding domain-containing protein [Planctomycetota bacterium]